MKFLGNVLAVIVGLLVFSVLSFFIFAGIIAAISASDSEVKVRENSVLHLNLNGRVLVERTNANDPDFSSIDLFGGISTVGLSNIKTAVSAAKNNENIKGIYLRAGFFSAGQAGLKEIRDALVDFKESGKFIISYDEVYGESGYYLSSVADEVYMNPSGMLEFNGFSSEIVFLKGMFQKIEVEPVVFRVGDFKSAVEPFLLDKMSDENRLQTETFLGDLNNFALKEIAESRKISLDKITEINNQMLVRKVQDAQELNLVDNLWYEDQVIDHMKEKMGLTEDDKISLTNITRMNAAAPSKNKLSKNRIAVIIAEGDIVDGRAEGSISSEVFKEEVRKARKNDDIKAVVIRINSPGGSALASEVIWRELEECSKVKPVIASMGEVAASGGYYIAAAADTIVAQPNTITGSIGIFALWFNAQGLLNNKLGITTDVAKTGEFSDFLSAARKLSEGEKAIFQNQVEQGYDTFLSRVASGRNMSKEDVMKVASGRVWSGIRAQEVGLVDILGGLEDAVQIAATKADIADDFRVIYYPESKPWFERFLNQFTSDVQSYYQIRKYGELYPIIKQVEKVNQYKGVMVRLPYDIEVK
ncbi:signal peptide peptidase SppA [Mongoliitalea daihaiensis]|uniref:signal peptide peptidase SppA n=1 Tax=Mongoliitalea daihaiensis TaxID=2782006 RepID=UPI001F2810F2|nr:signal peptide peptidase SppA [Mongoliitalea daihaiensis]UJP65200.1 signal peptide peptidase SppA [Mongoliitalea daihaiensis]